MGSITLIKNIGQKLDYKIELADGDRIEIKINTITEIDKTIPVGRAGTIFLYYQEDIIP